MLDRISLERALLALGELLTDRDQPHEVVAIGGGALSLLGLIERSTNDIDLVAVVGSTGLESAQPLPETLLEAIADIARIQNLDPKWMNSGPTSLMQFGLPEGFLDRCAPRQFGAFTLFLATRFDQIHFKVFAAADGRPDDKHHHDLKLLKPSGTELLAAARWARTHDPSDGFATMVRGVLASFGVDFGDG